MIFDLGDPVLANVIESQIHKALGFPFTKEFCSVDGFGNLVTSVLSDPLFWPGAEQMLWPLVDADQLWPAASDGDFWPAITDPLFWNPDENALFWDLRYGQATYTWSFTPPSDKVPSRLTISTTVAGCGWHLEYKTDDEYFWPALDAENLWPATDPEPVWPDASAWREWTGELLNVGRREYFFRLVMESSFTEGVCSRLDLNLDVPDITETFSSFAVGIAGSRLPITRLYDVIKRVNLTLLETGSPAANAKVLDKDPVLGPLVAVYDSSNNLTTGSLDAVVQGY